MQAVVVSETWTRRGRYIFSDALAIPLPQGRYSEKIPIEELGYKHNRLENTYSGLSWAMENSFGKLLEKIYQTNPKVKIIVCNHWDMPEVNILLKHDYAKNLILCKKSFGHVDIQSYENLVREGKIAGWGVALSSDGSPIISFTPQRSEILPQKVIG